MRRRGRWRRHAPAVAVMMVAAFEIAMRHASSRCGHGDAGECDCCEDCDEFHLVHGVVPFFACGCVFGVRSKRRSGRPRVRR